MGARRGALFVAAAVAGAILIAGCGSGGGGGPDAGASPGEGRDPVPGGKVVMGTAGGMDGFNPGSSRLQPSSLNVAKAIYDPIAAIDEEGVAAPYLVESLEPNEDFTQWTITMRDQDIRFHNGELLTPQILATHLKSMQLAPLTFFAMEPLDAVGVVDEAARPAFDAGEISQEEYDVQRRQVLVFMDEPWSTFPAFLAGFQIGYVAHPDYTDGSLEDPVGTGPFVFDEWVEGDHVTVLRNDDYWRDGLPYLNEVEFREILDSGSRLQSLEAGDLDMMTTNTPGQVQELSTEPPDGIQVVPTTGGGDEQVVILNTQTGPTADVEVRRALQLATDRGALDDQLYDGYFELADAPVEEGSVWYTDPGWPDPDAEAARRLVEAWEAENGPLSITLNVVSAQEDLEIAQVLEQQWAEAGIDTQIEAVDVSVFSQVLPVGDFEALMLQFFPGADPDENYTFWDPDEENIGAPGELSVNFSRYTSDVQKEALHGARQTSDQGDRAELYGRLWADWAENAPYLWLYHNNYLFLANDDVAGVSDFTFPDGGPAAFHVWGSVFLTQVWKMDG